MIVSAVDLFDDELRVLADLSRVVLGRDQKVKPLMW